jgi:hypothetical protein
MAAERGKTPGKQARRTTGSGPGARKKGGDKVAAKTVDVAARSRSRAAAKVEVPAALEAAEAIATERVTHITCWQSMFQLQAERENSVNGHVTQVADWTLDFGTRGFIVADDETIAAVEKVLAGQWTDGRVPASHFQRIAKKAGLAIVTYGLAQPPIPTWDKLPPSRVVAVAFEAGALDTVQKVAQAIRYENEGPERTPAREPRRVVLDELAQVEAVVAAGGGSVAQNAAPAVAGIETPKVAL